MTSLTEEQQRALPTSSSGCNTSAGLTRPRYFSGQLLTAADLQAEQDYFRKKMRRHNLCVYGWGIICGLQVTLDPKENSVVTVEPGCAIDRDGEELFVCEPVACKLSPNISVGYVSLNFCEKVVAAAGQPNERVEEGVSVQFRQQAPEGSVILGRLTRGRKRWTLDRKFRPKMV